MTQTRRRFPESFKREAVDQVLAGTPLRHVAETLGIAESLLSKWKRLFEQQGNDAFPGNGKQRGESAELRRLRQQLAQVTLARRIKKGARHLLAAHEVRFRAIEASAGRYPVDRCASCCGCRAAASMPGNSGQTFRLPIFTSIAL